MQGIECLVPDVPKLLMDVELVGEVSRQGRYRNGNLVVFCHRLYLTVGRMLENAVRAARDAWPSLLPRRWPLNRTKDFLFDEREVGQNQAVSAKQHRLFPDSSAVVRTLKPGRRIDFTFDASRR